MSTIKKSAMEKLKKLGLTDEEIAEMISFDDEDLVADDEEEMDRLPTTWQGTFLLEQLEYYNKSIGGKGKGARPSTETPIESLAEFVEKIQSGEIKVHFDWEALTSTPLIPTSN